MRWVFDLDGVIWLAGNAIPGSAEAVKDLRARGDEVAFVTNNSGPTVSDYSRRLANAGVEIDPSELFTSSQAAASILPVGSRAAFVGGPGVQEALEERGVDVVQAHDGPDAVVVGRSLELDFETLARAAAAIRGGARFVATNTDATFPTPDGPEPGAGALVAYLRVGSGHDPVVAGKPEAPMAEMVRTRFGHPDVVVGDRADTDGRFAERIGSRFALVLSGVTTGSDLPVEPAPAEVAADLGELVRRMTRG